MLYLFENECISIDNVTVNRYIDYKYKVVTGMVLTDLMKQKNMTKYRLSKLSGVPYATVSDICNGKACLEKCNAETVYRIAKALDVPMEELLEPCVKERSNFELFKSNMCHRLKEMGDIDFIINTLENQEIRLYYERRWYPESLYLLAMLDYVSRINGVPVCDSYDDIRKCRLEQTLYPSGVIALCAASGNDSAKKKAKMNAIPEFMRFNIVENEVRNVV